MSKKKLIIILVAVAVLGAGAAGGAMWFLAKPAKPGAAAEEVKPEKHEEPKYVTLEKVIVMLRRDGGGDGNSHYLSVDLVLTTSEKKEKLTKEHLPLLRSIAVKALSTYTMDKAAEMSVDQMASLIGKAFEEHYAKEKSEKPFSEVMIGKLIIE